MKKISILVVAPYPEFGELAVDIAKAYPQINVYVAPGIYQNAIEYTQIYPSKKFDCIISRSFTADLLRETSITPVIDVELSFFDCLSNNTNCKQYRPKICRSEYSSCNRSLSSVSGAAAY